MLLQQVQRIVISLACGGCDVGAGCGPSLRPKRQIRIVAHRRSSLFREESLEADLLSVCDEIVGWTEG